MYVELNQFIIPWSVSELPGGKDEVDECASSVPLAVHHTSVYINCVACLTVAFVNRVCPVLLSRL